MAKYIPADELPKLQEELKSLDAAFVQVDGKEVKPSSCYYFGSDPAHILYNTNCPEMLRHTIEGILLKYTVNDEGHSTKTLKEKA